MQHKVQTDIGHRFDGKFNVWRKVDIYYHDERGVHYGDWEIVKVCTTEDEALERVKRNA